MLNTCRLLLLQVTVRLSYHVVTGKSQSHAAQRWSGHTTLGLKLNIFALQGVFVRAGPTSFQPSKKTVPWENS